ncbi:MAG: riboflavin synthase [Phycisphaeraceae bacterium]|nr:riboflavin synthase [Phycisphaeraceae bacterium]
MFTGIVLGLGRVAAITPQPFGARLAIDPQSVPIHAQPGDSICVSGCCLTLAPSQGDRPGALAFDVIQETLAKTMLGTLKVGHPVNLEPSLTANTPLGGHFVQGHVDGVGQIARVQAGAEEYRITIRPPAELLPYIVPKGSVAIAGVSLTIASVTSDSFDVALIPTTLRLTTLGAAQAGAPVNLETDIVAKTIVHWLRTQLGEGGLTMDKLRASGFIG